MEGKESQTDILRLRQLEQAKQENSATTSTTISLESYEKSSSVLNETDVRVGNGYAPEAAAISEKMNDN